MTLSTLLPYLLLVVSSWLLVFRRRTHDLAPIPVVASPPEWPAHLTARSIELAPFLLPEPEPAAPWWASGQCVETSP